MTSTETEEDAVAQSTEEALLDYLRDRDAACPLCRYNLRGLTSGRCPECGRALQLTIGLVEPRVGAWVTALISMAGAASLGVLALVALARHGLMADGFVVWVAFFYFIAAVPVLFALIVLRRRYQRMPQPWQWAVAGLAALLTILALAGLAVQ